jgi:hypothetical protein
MSAWKFPQLSPGRVWATCLVAIVVLLILPPELYLWACIGAALIGSGWAIVHLTAQRDEAVVEVWEERFHRAAAEEKVETLRDALMAADQENAILAGQLDDVHPVPHLRVVPTQRDAAHDHLQADDDWFARLYDDKGNLR